MRPGGLLQPIAPLEWKWESVTCDFVFDLPRSPCHMDVVWVIIDHLTKSAHFIPIKKLYLLTMLELLYRDQIVKLHGVPKEIISDRDP